MVENVKIVAVQMDGMWERRCLRALLDDPVLPVMFLGNGEDVPAGVEGGGVAVDDSLKRRVVEIDGHGRAVDEPLYETLSLIDGGGVIVVESCFEFLRCRLRDGGLLPRDEVKFFVATYWERCGACRVGLAAVRPGVAEYASDVGSIGVGSIAAPARAYPQPVVADFLGCVDDDFISLTW